MSATSPPLDATPVAMVATVDTHAGHIWHPAEPLPAAAPSGGSRGLYLIDGRAWELSTRLSKMG